MHLMTSKQEKTSGVSKKVLLQEMTSYLSLRKSLKIFVTYGTLSRTGHTIQNNLVKSTQAMN